jgi:hypothetical protein
MNETDDDRMTPAEERVAGYLVALRDDVGAARKGDGFAASVARTVRWQSVARQPLRLIGVLAGALAEGLELLARSSQGGRR